MSSKVKEYASSLWWLFTLQGAVTLIFGLVALFWPELTLVGLVGIFALFIVVYGLVDLISAFIRMKSDSGWWLSLAAGIAALIIGVYLISNLEVAYLTFAILVGLFFVIRGILDIVVASVVEEGEDRLLWIFAGIIALIAGIVVWIFPFVGTVTFVWVLGLYAIVRGAVDVALAVRVRKVAHDIEKGIYHSEQEKKPKKK